MRHDFDAKRAAVAEAILDPKYQRSLSNLGPLAERKVLSQKTLGNKVERRTRYVLDLRPTGVAKSFLGDAKPAWIEVAVWDGASYVWNWSIEPEIAADFLDASGTIALTGSGAKTTRIVKGRVKVKVPLYGGKVENWIRDGIARTYDEEATRLTRWLSR